MLTNSHSCSVSSVPAHPASWVEAYLEMGVAWFVVGVVRFLSLF